MFCNDYRGVLLNIHSLLFAAKKVKYTFSSDEEGEKDEEEVFKDNHAVIGDNFTPTVHSGSESEPEDDYVASSPVR